MDRTLALLILLSSLACGCDGSRPAETAESAPPAPAGSSNSNEPGRDEPRKPDAIDQALRDGPGSAPASAPGRWLDDPPDDAAFPDFPLTKTKADRPAEVVYRAADGRPVHDDRRLAAFGIHRYESRHLRLYTDIAPEIARGLPRYADLLYAELERYFGPLPPARDGSVFQVTGYIIKEKALFRQVGLLPEDLPGFLHGRHRGQEFWMNDQQQTYYRRHLMLHEMTHCFMGVERDGGPPLPTWYMEGMAEHFAAHRAEPDGTISFRVMPDGEHDFDGFRRIDIVRDEIAAGRFRTIDGVWSLQPNDFLENPAYAWSWALCHWLDKHPRHHERFRALADSTTQREFTREFLRHFGGDEDLLLGWAVFTAGLCDGYDVPRSAIEFDTDSKPVIGSLTTAIRADRGWQSTPWHVRRGGRYAVSAAGRVHMAQKPIPWVSEPAGITFDYFDGRPIGQLLGAVRDTSPGLQGPADGLLDVHSLGERYEFTAERDGVLFLRVNDDWGRLADNTGEFTVTITPK
jgi:hypothetical protein